MSKVSELEVPSRRRAAAGFTTFVCPFPGEVAYLVGDFNGWDPQATRMLRNGVSFQKRMRLAPGRYEYKFIVDGQWRIDPYATEQRPNEYGSLNSVVRV